MRPDFKLTLNPREVTETFEVPLDFLMTPENHQRRCREWKGIQREYPNHPAHVINDAADVKSPRELQAINSPVPCLGEDDSRLWFVSANALHSLENGNHVEHAVPRNFRPFFESQAVDYATRLYTQGQTGFLDVLSAQRSLYASEDALVRSVRQRRGAGAIREADAPRS